jgi:hypothetical protein
MLAPLGTVAMDSATSFPINFDRPSLGWASGIDPFRNSMGLISASALNLRGGRGLTPTDLVESRRLTLLARCYATPLVI